MSILHAYPYAHDLLGEIYKEPSSLSVLHGGLTNLEVIDEIVLYLYDNGPEDDWYTDQVEEFEETGSLVELEGLAHAVDTFQKVRRNEES